MGSFLGHALPGSFFIVFGTWCTVQIFRRYFQSCQRKDKSSFRSTVFFPIHTRKGWINIDSYIIIVCAVIGIIVELGVTRLRGIRIIPILVQHATMYFFFGMLGMFAVVCPKVKLIPRHHELLYVLLALAFTVEGILFKFHTDGRPADDIMLHTLLVYTIIATVIVILLEMKHRDNVILALSRAFVIILQGTWFWQIGFSLYPPIMGLATDTRYGKQILPPDHDYLLYLVCYFTWHLAVIVILMTVSGGIIGYYYKRKHGQGHLEEEGLLNEHHLESQKTNGYKILNHIADIEEEI